MKRILLFVLTNIAVVAVLSIVLSVLGVNRFLTAQGLNVGMLLVFSLVVGFTGSIISLLISKPMAKWSTGANVITQPMNSTEQWLLETVSRLAARAGIGMPEVAVYEGEPNAFATGALSKPHYRYQTRIAWLFVIPPLVLLRRKETREVS